VEAAALIARLPSLLRRRVERDKAQRLANLARNISIAHNTAELLDAAERAGLAMLPIKGALLANTIWDDPGLRPMSDVDLVVAPADAAAAVALLATLGFRAQQPESARWTPRHAHAIGLVNPDRQLAVDLHYRLFHELDADGDVAPLFARAVEAPLFGALRRVPAWEDSLFLAAAHGAVDGFGGPPYWLLDLALLCERADFARAADEAARRRLKVAFSVAVALAHRALPDDVPAPPWPISSLRRALLDGVLGSDPLVTRRSRTSNLAARLLLADGAGSVNELIRKAELALVELGERWRGRSTRA
jgi:hypothetical protein